MCPVRKIRNINTFQEILILTFHFINGNTNIYNKNEQAPGFTKVHLRNLQNYFAKLPGKKSLNNLRTNVCFE